MRNGIIATTSVANEKRSLRIAIVSDTAPPQSEGGIGSAHYNLFQALRNKGFNAELFLFFHRGQIDGQEKHIHRYGPPARLHKILLTLNKWLFSLLAPGKIAWNTVDIFASGLGVRRMKPALEQFDADVIIIPDHGAPGRWIRPRKEAAMYLIAHHNPMRLTEAVLGNYSKLDAKIAVWLEQKVLQKVKGVTCPSHHMKEWFERAYRFDGEVKVIANLIDKDDVLGIVPSDLRTTIHLTKEAVLIGIPSAQTAVKGSKLLAEIIHGIASRTTREVGFYLAGEVDHDLAITLQGLPKNAHVHLPGRLAHDEYLAAFKSCSFGIFPSLRDNYSMALLEAAVGGIPMVAFDSGGNADIIKDGENGYLIGNLDTQSMIDTCVKLVQDPDALQDLTHKTKQYSLNHFDSSETVNEYIDFFSLGI